MGRRPSLARDRRRLGAVCSSASLFGGYWIAERLELGDRDRLARDTLEEMKRSTPGEPPAKYARIEDIPGPAALHRDRAGPAAAPRSRRSRGRPSRSSSPRPQHRAPRRGARNAVPFRDLNSRPLVAIVIDDVGIDRPHSKRAWELPGPLTMSFLPYAKDLREQARGGARAGPGADAASADGADRPRRSRAQCAAGVAERRRAASSARRRRSTASTAMSASTTTWAAASPPSGPAWRRCCASSRARGLMFLDSRTTAQSVGDQVAQEMGVPSVVRNVFLDDDESLERCAASSPRPRPWRAARASWWRSAIRTRRRCRRSAEWLPGLAAKGMALAPATAVLRKRNGWD